MSDRLDALPSSYKVGLVATRAWSDPTGIGEYTRNLYQALQRRVQQLWLIHDDTPTALLSTSLIRSIAMPARGRRRSRWFAPPVLKSHQFSLLHFMTESELFFAGLKRTRLVVTIHGCAATRLPPALHQQLPRRALIKYRYLLNRVAAIITVSEASRQDIIETFRVPSEKVTVIHNGIADAFHQRATTHQPTIRPAGERPFILAVGATIPKKNIVGVVQALAMLKANGLPHRLIHVGPRDWGYDAIVRRIAALGLHDDVEFKGRVSTDELIQYYARADVFVFPSFHEGFGMPILEAMACGCPVVTSNCYAMPEVAGDAALLVDPHDSEQIADAIERLLTDEQLRGSLIDKGRRRAQWFTWDRAGDQVVAVYQRILC